MSTVDLATFPEWNPNPIVEADATGCIHYANPAALRLFPDLMTQNEAHPFLQDLESFFHAVETSGMGTCYRDIKVENRYYAQQIYYVQNDRRARIYGFDVTDKMAVEALKTSLDRELKAVLDAIITPVFIIDNHSTVIRSNAAATVLYGVDMTGRSSGALSDVLTISYPDRRKTPCDELPPSRALQGEQVRNERFRVNDAEGYELIIEASASPIVDGRQIVGAVTVIHDVTDREKLLTDLRNEIILRRRIEAELLKAHEDLENKVRLRTAELERLNETLREKVAELEKAKVLMAEQSRLFEAFFENSLSPLVFLDKDFNFIRVNEAYARACQRDISEFAGRNHFELYPSQENEAIFRRVVALKEAYAASAKPFDFPDHPEWGTTYWDWMLTPLLDDRGEVICLVFSLNDVTDSKRRQSALEEREKLLQIILESLPVGVWVHDAEGRIVQGNRAGKAIWGGMASEGIDRFDAFDGWWLSTGEKIDADQWSSVRAIKRGETSLGEEIRIRGLDGTSKIILNSSIPIKDEAGEVVGAVTVHQDITKRKEAEGKVLKNREHLRALSAELVLAEERERKRISTLLHDRIAQMLAAAKMKLTLLEKGQTAGSSTEAIDDVRKLINQSIRETRSLMMEISPPILYELGLAAAMEWLTEHMAAEYRMDVRFRNRGSFDNLPQDVTILLFQATRELLINAGKHSSARRVAVAASEGRNEVEIQVSDNGIGFDAAQLGKPTAEGRYGLFSIRERLKSYDGDMKVESSLGEGTTVILKIPRMPAEKKRREEP